MPSEIPPTVTKPVASSYVATKLENRLLLASNRLPVSIKSSNEGKYEISTSSGGLATGLSGLAKATSFSWYGWPGLELPEGDVHSMTKRLKTEYDAIPVWLDDDLADRHYNGFSNSVLWPLLHYHPDEMDFKEDTWGSFKAVNRMFAQQIARDAKDGDLVWVHDYHLMLLPAMLREELADSNRNVKIGFFLHTPFPSSEIWRMLPVREEVLQGVLQSDLVGFHTFDYVRHFLSACDKTLSLTTTPNSVKCKDHTVTVSAFPIGINVDKITEGLQTAAVRDRIAVLKHAFKDVKVLIGVDRLDYIKGIPQKLHALELFFNKYPRWREKVVLIQVAVPSRQDVEEYQDLRTAVNELVGKINGEYGTAEYTPVHYMHKSVPFDELIALYAIADACLITSTRDGMNLVAYEYVASQEEKQGVLMLSEFAGAAESLNGALKFNPWNTAALADIINEALSMDSGKRAIHFHRLHGYIKKYTSAFWGQSFAGRLAKLPNHNF